MQQISIEQEKELILWKIKMQARTFKLAKIYNDNRRMSQAIRFMKKFGVQYRRLSK